MRSASSHELSVLRTRLNLRRLSFSSHCRSDLEQSSAARHIRAVTSCLLHSLEDILLRTVLFIKLFLCLQSDIVILDTLIVLLTYLLTQYSRCSRTNPLNNGRKSSSSVKTKFLLMTPKTCTAFTATFAH